MALNSGFAGREESVLGLLGLAMMIFNSQNLGDCIGPGSKHMNKVCENQTYKSNNIEILIYFLNFFQ